MLYVIFSTHHPNSAEARARTRPAHLARLEQLKAEGRLVVAGPCPAIDREEPGDAGFIGGITVAEFSSLEEAKDFAKTDPYNLAGVYKEVIVRPFKKVLP